MNAVEITLIIIGVIFIVVSFFVQEKLSKKDLDLIAKMSEDDLTVVVAKKMEQAENELDNKIEEKIEEKVELGQRSMEKLCNEKIMAINEYSDTVLDSINKNHNETMFLYSMLNDKHKELTDFVNETKINKTQEEKTPVLASDPTQKAPSFVALESSVSQISKEEEERLIQVAPVINVATTEEMQENTPVEVNHNEEILSLHKKGITDVEIAKKLGLGLGEVKLVIGLYKEEV